MIRFLIFVIFLSLFSQSTFALDIMIKPSKNYNQVSQADIKAMQEYVKRKYHLFLYKKSAKDAVIDSRILSNEYFKKRLFTPIEKKKLQIELEMRYADKYIDYLQRKIKIPEKVLKSYYYDNIEKFRTHPEVQFIRYRFNNYKDAYTFYQDLLLSKNPKKIIEKYHPKVYQEPFVKITKLKEPYKSFVQSQKSGYPLPPIVVKKNVYDVFYIKNYKQENKYKPYEKVKKEIEDLLYKQTFAKRREEILKKYRDR